MHIVDRKASLIAQGDLRTAPKPQSPPKFEFKSDLSLSSKRLGLGNYTLKSSDYDSHLLEAGKLRIANLNDEGGLN